MKKYSREKYVGMYGSWYAMKQRCGNPKHSAYHNYGGRGITYPEKWESYQGFKEDMEETYKKGLTIDRINNNDSYSKENCRWLDRKSQCNNMRKNVLIEYQGITLTSTQWAEKLGLRECTFKSRRLRGWTLERMMNPKLERPCKL
jgi:hypothetical protein